MDSTRNMRIVARTMLFVVLVLLLILLLPVWPYSSGWGSYPSLAVAALLVALIILLYRITPRYL